MLREYLAMTRSLTALLIAIVLVFGASFAALAQEPGAKAAPAKPRALPTQTKEWKGDFNDMLRRRHIRFLVPYSRTLYFNDKGRERGITADTARDFEHYINQNTRNSSATVRSPFTSSRRPGTSCSRTSPTGSGTSAHRTRSPFPR
jgi:hypothetical protein